jgi:hypothetical protein
MFKNRSVVEIMVLIFAYTVSASVLVVSIMMIILVIYYPEKDIDNITRIMTSIVSAMLGALLGLLAGKSEAMGLNTRPTGELDPMAPYPIAPDHTNLQQDPAAPGPIVPTEEPPR